MRLAFGWVFWKAIVVEVFNKKRVDVIRRIVFAEKSEKAIVAVFDVLDGVDLVDAEFRCGQEGNGR